MKHCTFLFFVIVSLWSCKATQETIPVVIDDVVSTKAKDDLEYDRFISKIKRLKASLSTQDYNSANSIMRMLDYDMKREIGQTKALLSTEVEDREALESIFKKQQLMARQLSRFIFKKGDPFQKITAAVNQLNKFADTMK